MEPTMVPRSATTLSAGAMANMPPEALTGQIFPMIRSKKALTFFAPASALWVLPGWIVEFFGSVKVAIGGAVL